MPSSRNIQLILIATLLTMAPSVTRAAPAPSSLTARAVASTASDLRGWGVGSY